MNNSYVIGVDFGSDSVRALVVNTQTGETVGTHVHEYARWKQGLYCDPATRSFGSTRSITSKGWKRTITVR